MRRTIGYSLSCWGIALAATPGSALADNLTCGDPAAALIDDFEDGNTLTPDGFGGWYLANDGTGTQLPRDVSGLVVPGGRGDSRFSAHTSGEGFTEWGAVVGVGFGCARSVEAFDGFRFATQAAAGTFDVKLVTLATQSEDTGGECTEVCNDHFALPLAVADGRWYECSVRFEDLAQQCWGTAVDLDLDAATGIEVFHPANASFITTLDDLRFESELSQSGCVALEPQLQCETE